MRNLIIPLLIIAASSCKPEGGHLKCTVSYELDNTGKNTDMTGVTDERYTQFGDFITSITPSRFVGKFLHVRHSNWFMGQYPGDEFNLDLFDNNLDIAHPMRIADFSNNSTVTFIPEDTEVRATTDLIYFMVTCLFWYQELDLPDQYGPFQGNQLQFLNLDNGIAPNFDGHVMGAVKEGSFLRASHEDFMAPIFAEGWGGFAGNYPVTAHNFIFGNTDSTWVFYQPLEEEVISNDTPMGQGGYIVRSHRYVPTTITAISAGEERTISATMRFNTTDLIHIYAGADNVPYTSDDIFVYAPRFWERIAVSLEYN